MKITIHRGSSEIGGSCVEISSKNTKILIDLGQPLTGDDYRLPASLALFDAVLISHPHQDHFGLIEQLSPNVPVYIGELGQKLIQASRLFLQKKPFKNDFVNFKSWESFPIGDFQITPYLVDHSATDAHAFLIEGEGKRIFYSGDFRAHGRKSKVYYKLLREPPESIDLLFMEGTMLLRDNEEFPNETAVEKKMLEILLNEPGPCFLLSSSQNIDRLVSAYRASKKAGRIFVVDIYTAWILRELSQFFDTTPAIHWDDIRVLSKGWTARNHYLRIKENPDYFEGFVQELYKKENVITHQKMAEDPQKYFIKSSYIEGLIKELGCNRASVIYSMWKGYLSEEYNPKGYKRLQDLQNNPQIKFTYAHTSGHAIVKDLQGFAEALSPKILVPIHTEHKDQYSELFSNVSVLANGEEIVI